MSIIYNGQTVAGVYAEQILNNADTINAGIIKIATQEEVDAGENNTSAVTPLYLSSKQNKLKSGDNISIENDIISCDIKPDVSTIIQNEDGTLTNVGQLTKSGTIKIDWEGTQAEYNVAYLNGTIQPDWYCYITDDEEFVDYADVANQSLSNLRPEGEARFTVKANTDLDNLSEVGEDKLNNLVIDKADKATTLNGYGITDGLNKNQITNCLLEVPQNIKLELNNGTLTLKAGSEVIVPNGFEEDGVTPKFDYVTIESDKQLEVSDAGTGNESGWFIFPDDTGNRCSRANYSGATTPTLGTNVYAVWYDTGNNIIKYTNDSGATWLAYNASLPICVLSRTNGIATSIDQVFNGMGYIGSTVWVDKGVKGLIPNGRNEDGTLKNIEIVTNKVALNNSMHLWGGQVTLNIILFNQGSIEMQDVNRFSTNKRTPVSTSQYIYSYDEEDNYWYYSTDNGLNWVIQRFITIGSLIEIASNKSVSNFQQKLPFMAVDYNDKAEISGWALPGTKRIGFAGGASGATYTAPANGYFEFGGKASSASVSYFNAYIVETDLQVQSWIPPNFQGNSIRGFLPCKKGQKLSLSYYSMTLDVLFFRYAEGDQ